MKRILTLLLVSLAACETSHITRTADGGPVGLPRYRGWTGSKIVQGAQPEGDEAFKNLAALGVTTVLSVDGAIPDVDGAEAHGLTYRHVPIGYDAVPRDKALQIVKVVEKSEGLVYIHCHHGRHRGPAAVMVARIALDGISKEEANESMVESGTSPKYQGLFRDVREFKAPTDAELEATPEPESKVVPAGTRAMMVDVNERYEWLKKSKTQSWKVPEDSPDVSPPHEARMLWELYREMKRLDESKEYGADYLQKLDHAEKVTIELEKALRKSDRAAATKAYKAVKASCNDCHTDYRNN